EASDSATFFNRNNRWHTEFEINEVLAYDDGSPELVAGTNVNGGQFAVRFDLAVPDTLTHVDICFPRVAELPGSTRFQLSIYNRLDGGNVLRTQEYTRDEA